MKTPDKIYIPYYPNDNGLDTHLGDDWFDNKDIDQYVEGWKEYISKDALLEWAKEHQEGERQGSYTWSCYQIFIDKLNSM